MLAVDTQSLYSAPQETASIGNKAAGKNEVVLTSDKAVATFIGVRWDGDKVRGIRVELSDGSFKQAGGYDDAKYALTQYHFVAGETLVTADLRDSGYGYGSLRQIEFETSLKKTFTAGREASTMKRPSRSKARSWSDSTPGSMSTTSSTRLLSLSGCPCRSPSSRDRGSQPAPSAIRRLGKRGRFGFRHVRRARLLGALGRRQGARHPHGIA